MISVCPLHRIHEVLPIGERFFNAAGEPGTFSPEAFMQFWHRQYTAGSGLLLIGETEGVITSGIGLITYNEPWTGDLVCSEVCWYSESREGLKLFKAAEELARNAGAKVFYMQHINNEDSARAAKIYVKNGFKLGYLRYVKEL